MLALRWTEQALEHLGGIAEYLSLSSPVYPELGKPAREKGDPSVRELVDAPYRIFYRVRTDAIEVLAVVHGRNQVPTSL